MPHRHPDRGPARRLAPRAPRTQDHKTKTGGLGLLPPLVYIWGLDKISILGLNTMAC